MSRTENDSHGVGTLQLSGFNTQTEIKSKYSSNNAPFDATSVSTINQRASLNQTQTQVQGLSDRDTPQVTPGGTARPGQGQGPSPREMNLNDPHN